MDTRINIMNHHQNINAFFSTGIDQFIYYIVLKKI